jgi:hypothetical protein
MKPIIIIMIPVELGLYSESYRFEFSGPFLERKKVIKIPFVLPSLSITGNSRFPFQVFIVDARRKRLSFV